jgi:starch-binding outer membrane protein, SusD/RagB family
MYKKYIITICLAIITLTSCKYLDFDEVTGQSKDYSYSYFDEFAKNVTHIYGQLQSEFGAIGGALREAATDNAVYTWQNNNVYDIYNNTWSKLNPVDDVWSNYYSAIRSSNVFLENYSNYSFERFKHNTTYDTDSAKASVYPFEARFLRAYFFFELSKRYGDIPLLTKSYTVDEINQVQKSSYDQVVDFIANECDNIAPKLPVTYRSFFLETGRATRGAAMALKSRALLYAASALHNPTNDPVKWERAAKASLDLILNSETNGWYRLEPTVNLFSNGNAMLTAKELIFERRNQNSNSFEATNLPIGFEGGNSGNTPTQNLVDAFEMKDGTPFSWNNPEHAANPYVNRDPRFYKTIAYNGSVLMNKTIETFEGGLNGFPINGATLTGYYLKKYIDQTVSLNPVSPVSKPHHYVIFRYAEILLNYAEALNEWRGPDYKDAVYTLSAREALNKVRANATMPAIVGDNSKDEFRISIRNERRIELAFEDHRFWDIRRWKIGDVVKKIYGIKIVKNGATLTYNIQELLPARVWDDKMYLYPITQSEVYTNKNLTQNPGW